MDNMPDFTIKRTKKAEEKFDEYVEIETEIIKNKDKKVKKVNYGKIFEKDFKDSIPDNVFFYRF